MVWAPNSVDWVVAALSVSYAGGVLVPVNSRYTGHEVADIVQRTNAVLAVVADGFLGRTQIADLRAAATRTWCRARSSISPNCDAVDGGARSTIDDAAAAVSPDDVADILFTSGTTGRPKGAMSAHRQTIGVAPRLGRASAV